MKILLGFVILVVGAIAIGAIWSSIRIYAGVPQTITVPLATLSGVAWGLFMFTRFIRRQTQPNRRI